MFDSLQEGLSNAFRHMTGKATLTESNMREGLQMVRQSLLEADVSYQVVQDFMAKVTEQAIGEKVLKSLNPSQQLVGVVHEELINLMGPVDHSLHLKSGDVTVLMMCGLQGSGKTTTCGKLAMKIKAEGRKPMLVAADLQRPAAVQQLRVLGEQIGVPVYAEDGASDPVLVCQRAVTQARSHGANVVILDTAGRLHIDQELMQQLVRIDNRCQPDQVYLVVDAMTGQDAVNSAKAFNEALELDGLIMTKLDGDARGGAALSVKSITGVPIKFMGTGEHLDAIEDFHPDRLAGRILGMGDVLSLVETAKQKLDEEEMRKNEERLRKGEFNFEMFRNMLDQTSKLGPINKLMSLIPGMGQISKLLGDRETDKDIRRIHGIIDSMTVAERRNPKLIDQSRRRRIAAGAGVDAAEVNGLIKQFDGMAHMMKAMSSMGMMDRMKAMQALQQRGAMDPTAMLQKPKGSTGKRLTPDERARQKKLREREARREMREKKEKRAGNDSSNPNS